MTVRPSVDDGDRLVREAQSGDLAAFEALHREHVGRVFAICLRVSGDRGRAEDLTQDAFVRAWESLDAYRSGTDFSAWLGRVAVNVALSDRRARGRRESREAASSEGRRGPVDRGLSLDLDRAITELPPTARRVFVLHAVEGYRHDEIADLLGITAGTSKTHLHRARHALRKALLS